MFWGNESIAWGAKGLEVGQVRAAAGECFVRSKSRKGGCGGSISGVHSGEESFGPVGFGKRAGREKCTDEVEKGEVEAFGDPILAGGVGSGEFVGDAVGHAVIGEAGVFEFSAVVGTESGYVAGEFVVYE